MTRLIFSAAAAACVAIAAPAFAQAAPQQSFTHDGVTYVYTATQQGRTRILAGKTSDGGTFELTVRNQRVDGYVNNQHVAFAVPRKPAFKTEVAAR